MLLDLSLPCQLSCSDQCVSGGKETWLVHPLTGGRKDCMTCTYTCMMGPSVEVVHAQSDKEVSYSPISLCVDDQAKSGAKSILFHSIESEMY